MPYPDQAAMIKKRRRATRARRRDRRRTRALALRALARNADDLDAARAELRRRRHHEPMDTSALIRNYAADEMLYSGITAATKPQKRRR